MFQAVPQRQAPAPYPARPAATRIVPTEIHPQRAGADAHPPVPEARPAVAMPEPAAPDLPAALGWAIIGSFGAVMLAFIVFFGGSPAARFMTLISLGYLVVYLAVPVIFFRLQAKAPRQTRLAAFLRDGIQTWTGHLTASEAAFQILTIPITLACGVVALGIVALLAR